MTKEEAIDILNTIPPFNNKEKEAIAIAIESINQIIEIQNYCASLNGKKE